MERYLRTNHWSYFHPVGTCAIGQVVDSAGQVEGVRGAYVIDASIMPCVPTANTHLPVTMLAERGAALLSL